MVNSDSWQGGQAPNGKTEPTRTSTLVEERNRDKRECKRNSRLLTLVGAVMSVTICPDRYLFCARYPDDPSPCPLDAAGVPNHACRFRHSSRTSCLQVKTLNTGLFFANFPCIDQNDDGDMQLLTTNSPPSPTASTFCTKAPTQTTAKGKGWALSAIFPPHITILGEP